LRQFNDSNERENASVHWIVDHWIQAENAEKSAERAKENAERERADAFKYRGELNATLVEKV